MGLFKSLKKTIKKAAPFIGTAIGYGLGGPAGGALYGAIGGGIGGLVAGQDVEDALKTAALAGATSYGAGKLFSGTKFAPGFARAGAASPSLGTATASTAGVPSSTLSVSPEGFFGAPGETASTIAKDVASASKSPGIMGLIKDNKLATAALGLGALGALGSEPEEEETGGGTPRPFPVGQQLDINVRGRDGEILNLANPDDARRYRESLETRRAAGGEVTGPGTGTSDSVPARLSDGEFVLTAKAVRGAGGGDRDVGAARMYDMMADLEAVG